MVILKNFLCTAAGNVRRWLAPILPRDTPWLKPSGRYQLEFPHSELAPEHYELIENFLYML